MINSFFKRHKYKSIKLRLSSKGPYDTKDSEWNYSDIPHLNYIHTQVDGLTLHASRTHIASIFLQKIGPIEIPASVSIIHERADLHSYVMIILNIAIGVETTHESVDEGCLTTTNYTFFYKGIAGWIVCMLARFSTRRNYRILMSEDMPMRYQRGRLRDMGVMFKLDEQELIGFSDTLDISLDNIDCSKALDGDKKYGFKVSSTAGSENIECLFLRAEWENGLMSIFPLVCPHEGAELVKASARSSVDCEHNTRSTCPWHGRTIRPISTFRLDRTSEIRFYIYNVNFTISIVVGKSSCSGQNEYYLTFTPESPKSRSSPLTEDY
jgi:hypothetical protein